MYSVSLPGLNFAAVWREAARRLAAHRIDAADVDWRRDAQAGSLFDTEPPPQGPGAAVVGSAALVDLTGTVICHADPQAPALAYRALLRHQTDRAALGNPADPLTRRLEQMAKSVRRDIHKMHAFVRFRELPPAGNRRAFGAWFEPDHLILETATPFFARRFADMDWTIATPQGVARFSRGVLSHHPPAAAPNLPEDAAESLWATYFANIFNPARIHLAAMRSEMPVKYWKNLPETRLIPDMLAGAEARVAAMRAALPSQAPAFAAPVLARQARPDPGGAPATLAEAGDRALSCRRCHLCEAATRTVWGEGDPDAALMIVGEQPGNHEDLAGRPFVGPAGTLLRQVMAEAGVGRAWLTNAVKHFKFVPRGKQRIHQNPNRSEIDHCRWWLDLERRFVAPRLTVALGATAALALTGSAAPMRDRRGTIEQARDGGEVLVSWHPSYLLRADPAEAPRLRADLLGDLTAAVARLAA